MFWKYTTNYSAQGGTYFDPSWRCIEYISVKITLFIKKIILKNPLTKNNHHIITHLNFETVAFFF